MANTYTQILRQGTYAQYLAIPTKDANLLYFCTDNGKLYKGTVDFTDSFVSVTAENLPTAANAVPGKIYYVSDESRFVTKIGNALVPIERTLDVATSDTTSSISASSVDSHVPSSKNVYLYGQEILAQATGGSAVVKEVEAGQVVGGVQVTKGDNSTSTFIVPGLVSAAAAGSNAAEIDITNTTDGSSTTITVPGVVTGVAAGSSDAQIAITNSTGADSTTVTVPGVVTTPTWDATSRVLTLPVSNGEAVEVNIGKDIFLDPAGNSHYDTTTQEIVLVLNDDQHTEIRVPVGALIDVYTGGETSTASAAVSTSNVITVDVKLDQHSGNAISIAPDTGSAAGGDLVTGGLRVDLSAYALDENLQALAAATTAWGSFT